MAQLAVAVPAVDLAIRRGRMVDQPSPARAAVGVIDAAVEACEQRHLLGHTRANVALADHVASALAEAHAAIDHDGDPPVASRGMLITHLLDLLLETQAAVLDVAVPARLQLPHDDEGTNEPLYGSHRRGVSATGRARLRPGQLVRVPWGNGGQHLAAVEADHGLHLCVWRWAAEVSHWWLRISTVKTWTVVPASVAMGDRGPAEAPPPAALERTGQAGR